MAIGERLKEERSRLGFSQTDFGALAGVGKTTQINYEKGNGSPSADYLAAIAEKGVDVLYVVTGTRAAVTADGLSSEESEVLNHYRSMPDSDRAAIRRMSSALAESAGRYVINSDQ
ncbi:XRE family transcriptional regulator [Stutzerimonas zhaodongensis]|uniref:XRE family transcriptional regulator n=1 Tax=Stutzerimonas zhaodongensis TaxID=1176257 RepID=A0A3M2I0P1_9GAMM|nr:helix-turn-helix transcriptional regulator [Stutzerimonas zhaodongensis]MCQ4314458.1 helix-turn-helix domain-containing protein [Stutzerimonas zhaodongensis]RMH91977.1 XRE family transcriptional regulator [Stutzerimonas zhaodongensis]